MAQPQPSKPTPGTLFGSSGEIISRPPDSVEHLNLPPGVQALIETRVLSALTTIRSQIDDDLERIADQKAASGKKLSAILAFIGAISIGCNIFVFYRGQEMVIKWVEAYFNEQILKPQFDNALKGAAQKEASIFMSSKLLPLEIKAESIAKTMDNLRIDIQDKQIKLAAEQAQLRELLRLPQLAASIKVGSNDSLVILEKAVNSGGENSALAKTFLDDVIQYYDSARHSFTQIASMDSISKQQISLTLEEAISRLSEKDEKNREVGANELYRIKSKRSVAALLEALQNEKDLRVVSRITKTLQEITKLEFAPLEKEKALNWWKGVTDKTRYEFPLEEAIKSTAIYPENTATQKPFTLKIEKAHAEKAIPLQRKVLSIEPKAGLTQFHLIISLNSCSRTDEAEAELGEFDETQKNSHYFFIAKAMIEMERGKINEAASTLNEVLKKFPMQESNVRQWTTFSDLDQKQKIQWPSETTLIDK